MRRMFCMALLLFAILGQAPATRAEEGGEVRVITGDAVRLRSGPSTETNIVTKMDKGTRVLVLQILPNEPWAKVILLEGNAQGWVHTDYLSAPAAPRAAGPARQPFADVVTWDEKGWAVLGPYPRGTPVRLLSEGMVRVYAGEATETSRYDNECSGHEEPMTYVTLDPGQDTSIPPILGVVGAAAVTPVRARELPGGGEMTELDARILGHPACAGLKARGAADAVRAYEVVSGGVKLYHAAYEFVSRDGDYVTRTQWLVFLVGNHVLCFNAGCAEIPEFFEVDGKSHAVFTHGDCNSGDYNKVVLSFGEDGIRVAYHSSAFAC